MSRLSIIALLGCLCAVVSGRKHHHHHTSSTQAVTQYSSWEGYSAGMVLPNTVAEPTNVAKGSCQDGCQNSCYGTFSIGEQCYALFVDANKNYTLPNNGSIAWKFATRDCTSGTNFIDFTGACKECETGQVTSSDGTGCVSPTAVKLAGAEAQPLGPTARKSRMRQRLARRDRVAREKRDLGIDSIFDEA